MLFRALKLFWPYVLRLLFSSLSISIPRNYIRNTTSIWHFIKYAAIKYSMFFTMSNILLNLLILVWFQVAF